MNREILFRGKRIDNGEWVEGFAYEHQPPLVAIAPKDYIPEKSKWYISRTAFADWSMPRQVEFIEVDPSTIGQYTGLCDKNGKKIFEGDILDCSYINPMSGGMTKRLFQIAFRGGAFMAKLIEHEPFGDTFLRFKNTDGNVIGNIHDNPELLNSEH